jgi:hypothetical protein
MKRLLSIYLLGVAVAACGTACGKSGGGTSPDPAPSGPPTRWSGTARFTRDLVADGPSLSVTSSTTWDVEVLNVTWVKVANPNPAPPAGGARYVVESGALRASLLSAVDFGRGRRCTSVASGDFPVPTDAPSESASGSVLELGPDGQYQGQLSGSVSLDHVQECTHIPSFLQRTAFDIALDINGAVAGGRIRGEMAPQVIRTETLTSTRRGSWDFTAN